MKNKEETIVYIWVDYRNFTEKWLERAEDLHRSLDKADRFIALWIAFNGWMRKKFGEDKKDWELIDGVKDLENMKDVYTRLTKSNQNFKRALHELSEYTVANMKCSHDRRKDKKYEKTYESLIDTIYQIRCNLFHGRKGTQETEEDYKLICLAHDILLPIFKKYLSAHHYS